MRELLEKRRVNAAASEKVGSVVYVKNLLQRKQWALTTVGNPTAMQARMSCSSSSSSSKGSASDSSTSSEDEE